MFNKQKEEVKKKIEEMPEENRGEFVVKSAIRAISKKAESLEKDDIEIGKAKKGANILIVVFAVMSLILGYFDAITGAFVLGFSLSLYAIVRHIMKVMETQIIGKVEGMDFVVTAMTKATKAYDFKEEIMEGGLGDALKSFIDTMNANIQEINHSEGCGECDACKASEKHRKERLAKKPAKKVAKKKATPKKK